MTLAPFQHVLALPRVRPLMLLMLLARIPPTAAGVTMTLHVAVTLDKGYGAAGLAGAMVTIGVGIGAPMVGRLIDRRGLRTAVLLGGASQATFWLTAPFLPYEVLLVAGVLCGLLSVPVMSIGRQVVTALVPPEQRRTALSLDSISVELSFMVGPAVGVLVATKVSTNAALTTIGLGVLTAAFFLYAINPKLKHADEVVDAPHPRRREWVTGPLLGTLVVAAGATFSLGGMEVAMVASLERAGQESWIGVVFIVACAASIVGGLVYGAMRRVPGQITLMALMGALAIPVGIGDGHWLLLSMALIPMNLMCAPTLTATTERIAALAPASVRGEAMGLQGAALTIGMSVGGPVTGFAIDHGGAPLGFAAAGIGGLVVALIAVVLGRR